MPILTVVVPSARQSATTLSNVVISDSVPPRCGVRLAERAAIRRPRSSCARRIWVTLSGVIATCEISIAR
jgi:hypothetical protein